jgi:hypothetical protein
MAKAKRMSDIFASSAEKSSSAATAPATPYSSEGPTLPIIGGADGEHTVEPERNQTADGSRTKRKAGAQPVPSFDPSLYEPWTLLPAELLKASADRLRAAKNVVPIAYSRNQNIKGGINRLKTYLGAYKNKNQPMDMPEALKETDVVIAVSAQGEGTVKLVSIIDMVRRVVAPTAKSKLGGGNVETWYLYTSLASIKVEKRSRAVPNMIDGTDQAEKPKPIADEDAQEEEEAFEPMDVDVPEQEQGQLQSQTIKAPILTVWMTKKKIPAFMEALGEQTFEVQTLPEDD